MTLVLDNTRGRKSTISPRLPWPVSERGVAIPVCESPIASYSLGVGLSRWNLVDPCPWIYFRPERREHGRAFGGLCGDVEKLTLFRGMNGSAHVQAEAIFSRLCGGLRKLAAKEGAR